MINSTIKDYLAQTLRRLLRPIVRIALRGELTHREFSDIAKRAYFDVARDDYGINGRKTNLARVAILTGLSRKECTRLKGIVAQQPESEHLMSPITRVITGWHEDEDYQDEAGLPLAIPEEGDAPSIADLIRRHGGDIPRRALQTELKRLGMADANADGIWVVQKRSFIADGFTEERIRILGNLLTDLGNTIVYNLDENRAENSRMARYVVADAIAPADAAEFQALATDQAQLLLQKLDHWLNTGSRLTATELPPSNAQRVGLGVYLFQESTVSGETHE